MYCHTIEGAASSGGVGPDLTHLASRDTLGAGVLENNPDNLAAWITDSQSIKPNNQMPNYTISPEDLDALIAYLESLE
jgi:cytochrome c oxidase subunit 2